jgi:hypothetical protein
MSRKLFYGLEFKKPKNSVMATENDAMEHPNQIKNYGVHAISQANYQILKNNFDMKQATKKENKSKGPGQGQDNKRNKLLVKLAGLRGEKKFKNDTLQYYAKDKKPEEIQKLKDDLVKIDEDIKKIQNELNAG